MKIYIVLCLHLVKPKNDDISFLKLNDEHYELAWIIKKELNNPRYETLHTDIINILLTKVFK